MPCNGARAESKIHRVTKETRYSATQLPKDFLKRVIQKPKRFFTAADSGSGDHLGHRQDGRGGKWLPSCAVASPGTAVRCGPSLHSKPKGQCASTRGQREGREDSFPPGFFLTGCWSLSPRLRLRPALPATPPSPPLQLRDLPRLPLTPHSPCPVTASVLLSSVDKVTELGTNSRPPATSQSRLLCTICTLGTQPPGLLSPCPPLGAHCSESTLVGHSSVLLPLWTEGKDLRAPPSGYKKQRSSFFTSSLGHALESHFF